MATFSLTTSQSAKISTDRLFWAGALTTVLATATSLVIYFIAESLTDLTGFPLLNPVSVLVSIGVASILATIVYGLLGRYTATPTNMFQRISVAVLLLSFLPIFGMAAGVLPIPGMMLTAGTVLTLMTMHTAAAIIISGMLTTVARHF